MRACPRSDGCFAFESSSRGFEPSASVARPQRHTAPRHQRTIVHQSYARRPSHDSCHRPVKAALARVVPAGRHQFSAHQPHSRVAGHPVRGLVRPDREPAGRATCRSASGGCSPTWTSSEAAEAAVRQPARLLHPRAQGRRAADRPRSRACWSAPATRSSAPAGRIEGDALDPGQGFPVHAAWTCSAIRSWCALPRRPLRDAAADVQHVPPLPRPARLPGRAGHLHLGRHLEHQLRSPSSASRSCSARTSAR